MTDPTTIVKQLRIAARLMRAGHGNPDLAQAAADLWDSHQWDVPRRQTPPAPAPGAPPVERVIVCGGRGYSDIDRVHQTLAALPGLRTVVHGNADGADQLAHVVALTLGVTPEPHPADWRRHGQAAGPVRNARMAALGADLCIAFPGGAGTADMVACAEAAGIPVRHVRGSRRGLPPSTPR